MVNGDASASLSQSSKASIVWRTQRLQSRTVGRKVVVPRNASTRIAFQQHKALKRTDCHP